MYTPCPYTTLFRSLDTVHSCGWGGLEISAVVFRRHLSATAESAHGALSRNRRPSDEPIRGTCSMIDLYYWPTPNGWKTTIMLAECGDRKSTRLNSSH